MSHKTIIIEAHTAKIYTKAGGKPFHNIGWLKLESIGKLSKIIPNAKTNRSICPIFFTDLAIDFAQFR